MQRCQESCSTNLLGRWDAHNGEIFQCGTCLALVLMGTNDGELYAVHQGNGSLAWSRNWLSTQARLVLTKVAMRDTDSGAGAGSRRAKEEGRRERTCCDGGAAMLSRSTRGRVKSWGLDLGLALARDPDHSARKKTGGGGSSGFGWCTSHSARNEAMMAATAARERSGGIGVLRIQRQGFRRGCLRRYRGCHRPSRRRPWYPHGGG